MALPSELKDFGEVTCGCGRALVLEVLKSAAGYYVGYHCLSCGAWGRESDYYETRAEAEAELAIALKWCRGLPLEVRM